MKALKNICARDLKVVGASQAFAANAIGFEEIDQVAIPQTGRIRSSARGIRINPVLSGEFLNGLVRNRPFQVHMKLRLWHLLYRLRKVRFASNIHENSSFLRL
jgi:hypothetical protein